MSRPGAFILLVLVTVAIISWWLKTSAPRDTVRRPQELEQADYFMTDFQIRQFDPQGRLHYRMRGRRMEHYPADDSAVIDGPDLRVRPGQPDRDWRIRAERATAPSRALEEIVFQGDVDLRRPNPPDGGPLSLETARLIIRPGAETLSGEGSAVLTGPGARIEGENLEADLKRGVLQLDRVRARYAP